MKYQVKVRTLRRGFSVNGIYCGRNTTRQWRKKGEWDQTDLCNNDIVKSFCKNNWITKNKGKHFLDMATMSDITNTVAVIENRYEAWDEEHGIDNAGEGEEQEVYRRPQKMVKTKFTNQVGKKRQCNMSGWSTDGIHFYNSVRASWRALSQDTTWTTFEEEWAAYEDKTNFGHSSRRKKDEHEEPEDDYYYDGGE